MARNSISSYWPTHKPPPKSPVHPPVNSSGGGSSDPASALYSTAPRTCVVDFDFTALSVRAYVDLFGCGEVKRVFFASMRHITPQSSSSETETPAMWRAQACRRNLEVCRRRDSTLTRSAAPENQEDPGGSTYTPGDERDTGDKTLVFTSNTYIDARQCRLVTHIVEFGRQ